ncbi:hypothetical protein [Peptoniphilus catoniae]|uniref:hypothetical protein n=1 Tax=Peptoniphilus catoniae TaxID=1660341 RepID=UPI0010FD0E97|nr:hypothetical protein [Peptoniphilus catoniae]
MKRYIKIGLLSLLLVIIAVVFIKRSGIYGKRDIVFDRTIGEIEYVKDFKIGINGIMLYDNDALYFCDKDGNLMKTVKFTDRSIEVYFANNFVFLYDKDLKKLYQYNDTGDSLGVFKLPSDLYNISYNNREIVLHLKREDGEDLKLLNQDGSLSDLYSTVNTILTYDLYESDKFSVAEILKDATGYKTILVMKTGNDKKIKEFSSEVSLYINRSKKRTIMATDKNLYVYEGDKEARKEIPNISDIMVIDRNIYLLHSNIISKYNFKPEEVNKIILSANVNKLTQVSNSLYAYGESDIGGELGKKSQFYTRLGTKVDKIEISGVTLGSLKEGKINLYKISNGRN